MASDPLFCGSETQPGGDDLDQPAIGADDARVTRVVVGGQAGPRKGRVLAGQQECEGSLGVSGVVS